jgi:hypothetical protein
VVLVDLNPVATSGVAAIEGIMRYAIEQGLIE